MTADIEKLEKLVERLRGDNGCPWDKEQTRETLKPMLIEEAFEVLDALDSGDPAELKEELGDLLFQIIFHSQIARKRRGEFDLADVIDRSHEKMVRRHPHIFGDADLKTSEDVLKNWEDIKAAEKGIPSPSHPESERSLLDGIPSKLPALHRAHQMTAKASRVGFDWTNLEDSFKSCRGSDRTDGSAVPGRLRSRLRTKWAICSLWPSMLPDSSASIRKRRWRAAIGNSTAAFAT